MHEQRSLLPHLNLGQPRACPFGNLSLRWVTLCVASVLMTIAATAAHAQLSPGNILVIDRNGGTDNRGALFKVDPVTGARTVVSDFGNSAQGALGQDPVGVAIGASGNILVVDLFARPSGGALFSVNPITGARSLIGDFPTPTGLTADVSNILVIDSDALTGRGAIFSVDPATGARRVVSDFGDPGQGVLAQGLLFGGAIDVPGNVFVVDDDYGEIGGQFRGALYKIDPTSGVRTFISDFNNASKGLLGGNPNSVAIDASGDILVTDGDAGTDGRGVLFRVNPSDGTRTVVSDFGNPAQGERGVDPAGVTIDASGNIFVIDPQAGTNRSGALFRVNPTTGIRTVVSDFGKSGQGKRGVDPRGVAVASAPPTQPVDLTIASMEVTQAIQDFKNSVPLVQDKSTYVRVYPSVDIADRRVGAQLRAFRANAELPGSPLRALNAAVTVRTTGATRSALNDSFNFWVPPTWRSGTVTFQAEINLGGPIPESDPSNNIFRVTKEFAAKAPVCVVMIPVSTHGSRYTVDSPGFDSIIDRFGSLWPVPEVLVYSQSQPVEELQVRFGIPPTEFGPYELTEGSSLLNGPADKDKVIISLFARDLFTNDPSECVKSNAETHYVGMVSPDSDTGTTNGYASFVSTESWVKMVTDLAKLFSTPPAGSVMAQELSHNYNGFSVAFGRWGHVNCGNPPMTNDFYPYAPNTLGPDEPDAFWGFDPVTKAVIAPAGPTGATDYMSYCRPRWVSDYTWRGMLDEIRNAGSPRLQPLRTATTPAALHQHAEILVLAGGITPMANVASFEYAYRLSQGMISTQKLEKYRARLQSLLGLPTAAYVLELLNTSGTVLLSQPFDSTNASENSEVEEFFLIVPFDPNTSRIRIIRNGQELGRLTVSPHAPQVRILQPSGDEIITDQLTVRWEASDSDNDPLLYTVQYSADLGASWQSLVTQTPETTLTLDDTRSLPGSNQQALIRVIANDGVNTGSDTSVPFTVQFHDPVVHITTPSDQAIFPLNTQIILMGRARDAEEGPLGDGALTWLVNSQLEASGKEAALDGLEPGTHVITLVAVDSDRNTATASVTITVVDDRPVANADSYRTHEDTPLTVDAPGVLGNDTSVNGSPLSAVLGSNASNGTLTLNADGSFIYTPKAQFSGADSFTYQVNDGNASSNVVTVSLTVGIAPQVNLIPIANAGPDQTGRLGGLIRLNGTGSSDPDNGPNSLRFTWTQTAGPAVALDDAITATPTFTPAVAGSYSFNLVVNDGQSTSSPDSVTVTVLAAVPTLGDIDLDGDVDRDDLNLILAARNTPAGPNDPRDLNRDGIINALDARQLVTLCTRPRCATQ